MNNWDGRGTTRSDRTPSKVRRGSELSIETSRTSKTAPSDSPVKRRNMMKVIANALSFLKKSKSKSTDDKSDDETSSVISSQNISYSNSNIPMARPVTKKKISKTVVVSPLYSELSDTADENNSSTEKSRTPSPVQFKELPQKLEINTSGISIRILDENGVPGITHSSRNPKAQAVLNAYSARRRLSTIESVSIEESNSDNTSARKLSNQASNSIFEEDEEERGDQPLGSSPGSLNTYLSHSPQGPSILFSTSPQAGPSMLFSSSPQNTSILFSSSPSSSSPSSSSLMVPKPKNFLSPHISSNTRIIESMPPRAIAVSD